MEYFPSIPINLCIYQIQYRRKNSLLLEIAGKLGYMKDEEIRSLLTNRITSEEITLEYIAKVLNIKNKKKKEEIEWPPIIMLD